MPPLHLDSGKTGCAHFRNDRVGRPEIGEIADLRLREIGVVQPVVGLLRTHIVEREPAAAPQHAKGLAQHARLVAEMVEGVLTADVLRAFLPHARAKKLARAAKCPVYSLTPSGV